MGQITKVKDLFYEIEERYKSWNKSEVKTLKLEQITANFSCDILFSMLNEINRTLFDGVPPPGIKHNAEEKNGKFILSFDVTKEFFIYENGKVVVKRCESGDELKELLLKLIPRIKQEDIKGIKYTTPCAEVFPRYEAIIENMPPVEQIVENIERKKTLFQKFKFKVVNFLDKKIINGQFVYSFDLKFSCTKKGITVELLEKYPLNSKLEAPTKILHEILTTIGE